MNGACEGFRFLWQLDAFFHGGGEDRRVSENGRIILDYPPNTGTCAAHGVDDECFTDHGLIPPR